MHLVDFDGQFMELLDTLIRMKQESVSSLFVERKLVLFMLNIIFEANKQHQGLIHKETRAHLIGCILKIEKIDKGQSIVHGFIPPNFFAEIKDLMKRT